MIILIIISLIISVYLKDYFADQAAKYLDSRCNKKMGTWPFKFRFSLQNSDYIDEKGIRYKNYWYATLIYQISISVILFLIIIVSSFK